MEARKRGRPDGVSYANGGMKKFKQETESTGIGSKSKPCTKFFSTSGCPFGESCHFLHYVPGGYSASAQMMNTRPPMAPPSRNIGPPPPMPNNGPGLTPSVKTRLCNKYNSAEGCRFGDKCHFAHGEWELGKAAAPAHDNFHPHHHGMGPTGGGGGGFSGRGQAPPPGPASGFGISASAKISIDGSLAGAVIGKGGVNSKQICRQTGAKLAIRDHESDPNLKNIELEGTFEQIKEANAMVEELISMVRSSGPTKAYGAYQGHGGGGPGSGGNYFKTKLCEKFSKGSCPFGDKCHFAHGADELRKA
ncbi:hypothetical protein V2J09_015936 [Rumex salicifolius]